MSKLLSYRRYQGEAFIVNKRLGLHQAICRMSADRKKKIANILRSIIKDAKRCPLYSDTKFYFRIKQKRESILRNDLEE